MPQPDNKREYGSTTQGSQRTVAPQGQMAADISPISGGAAAAQPVLQIGQQAQIKQTGAELYQALSGAFQGISQGIQNYEKMYDMVSKRDYANFESEYYAERERVNNDPKLMQDWMESSRYKPNRVTAGSYQRLRAGIYERDYEAQQQDDVLAMQKALVDKPLHEQIAYLGREIDNYEPDSPAYKWIERTQIEAGTKAASQARSVEVGTQTLEAQNKNIDLAGSILAADQKRYGDVLTTPRFRLALQAQSLGLASIEQDENGSYVFRELKEGGQTYALDALPQDLDERLAEGIGQKGLELGNDYVEGMLQASRLPASVINGGSSGKTRIQGDIINTLNSLGAGADTVAINLRSSDNPIATAGAVAEQIMADPGMTSAQKREHLMQVSSTFEEGSLSEAAWEQIESILPEDVTDKRQAAERMVRGLKEQVNGKIHKASSEMYSKHIVTLGESLSKATTPDEARRAVQESAMRAAILPENSNALALGVSFVPGAGFTPVSFPAEDIPSGVVPVGFVRPMYDQTGALPKKGKVNFAISPEDFVQESLGSVNNVKYLNEQQKKAASEMVQRISDWSSFEQAVTGGAPLNGEQLSRLAKIPGAHVTVQTENGPVEMTPLRYLLDPRTDYGNLTTGARALFPQAYAAVQESAAVITEAEPGSPEYNAAMITLERASHVYGNGNYAEDTSQDKKDLMKNGFLMAKIAAKTGRPVKEVFQYKANLSSDLLSKEAEKALKPDTVNPARDMAYEDRYGTSYVEDSQNTEDPEAQRRALWWQQTQLKAIKANPHLAFSTTNGTFDPSLFVYNDAPAPVDPKQTYNSPGRPTTVVGDVIQTLMDTPGWTGNGSSPGEYLFLQVKQATGDLFTREEFDEALEDLTDPTSDGGFRDPGHKAIISFVNNNFSIGDTNTAPTLSVSEGNQVLRNVAYDVRVKPGSELSGLVMTNVAIQRQVSATGEPLPSRRTAQEAGEANLSTVSANLITDGVSRVIVKGGAAGIDAVTGNKLATMAEGVVGPLAAQAVTAGIGKLAEVEADVKQSTREIAHFFDTWGGLREAAQKRIIDLYKYWNK